MTQGQKDPEKLLKERIIALASKARPGMHIWTREEILLMDMAHMQKRMIEGKNLREE